MSDNDKLFSSLTGDAKKDLKRSFDTNWQTGWDLGVEANRFTQRSYLLANAGGVIASVGFLGTAQVSWWESLAGLVALTIFFAGMCLSLISASLYTRMMQTYLLDYNDTVAKLLKDELPLVVGHFPFDKKILGRILTISAWEKICFFSGGTISIIALWVLLLA